MLKYLVDKEIVLTEQNDELGTHIYIDQLKDLVDYCMDSDYTETIGLIGSWGSGKSSIIRGLQEKLECSENKRSLRFVYYNAWKYSKDSFRKQFLINSCEGKNDATKKEEELYTESSISIIELNKIGKFLKKLLSISLILAVIVIFIVCFLDFSFLGDFYEMIKTILEALQKLFIVGAVSYLSELALRILTREKQVTTRKEFSPNDFSVMFKEISKNNRKFSIYVIDDLDRCDSIQMLEILDTIKGYLKSDNGNYLFLIPIDRDRLYRILEKERQYSFSDCEEYYSKLFDLSLVIKKSESADLFEMLRTESESIGLEISNRSLSLLSDYLINTPRDVKTHLNNLKVIFELYQKQREAGYIVVDEISSISDEIIKIYIIEKRWHTVFMHLCETYLSQNINEILEKDLKVVDIEDKQYDQFLKQSIHTYIKYFDCYVAIKDCNSHYKKDYVHSILNCDKEMGEIMPDYKMFFKYFDYAYQTYIIKRNLKWDHLPGLLKSYFYYLSCIPDASNYSEYSITEENIDYYTRDMFSGIIVTSLDKYLNVFIDEMIQYAKKTYFNVKYLNVFSFVMDKLESASMYNKLIQLCFHLKEHLPKNKILGYVMSDINKSKEENVFLQDLIEKQYFSMEELDDICVTAIQVDRKDVLYSIVCNHPEIVSKRGNDILTRITIFNKLNTSTPWVRDMAASDLKELIILEKIVVHGNDESFSLIKSKGSSSYISSSVQKFNSEFSNYPDKDKLFEAYLSFYYKYEKRNNDKCIDKIISKLEKDKNMKQFEYVLELVDDTDKLNDLYSYIICKTLNKTLISNYCTFLNEQDNLSYLDNWKKLITNKSNIQANFKKYSFDSGNTFSYSDFKMSILPELLSWLNNTLSNELLDKMIFSQVKEMSLCVPKFNECSDADYKMKMIISKINKYSEYKECLKIISRSIYLREYHEVIEKLVENVRSADELLTIHNDLSNPQILDSHDSECIKKKVLKTYPSEKNKFTNIVWNDIS